jgi:hypothetical protein
VLRDLIDGVRQYMLVEPDEEDKAVAAQCLMAFQKLLAKDQKEEDGAMGTSPAHKYLRNRTRGGY